MIIDIFKKIFCFFLMVESCAVMAAPAVGKVSLLIGEVYHIAADGRIQRLTMDTGLAVGERIETKENGHVHVRFIDGGLVSLRPKSRLTIEAYHYDAAHPQKTALKLRLDEGVMRSITGRWGEAEKARFRLNTPLAAIGVKGTDFTVQADAQRVRAIVNQGAIVVAPLGQGCLAEGLGPCGTPSAQLLAAEMGSVMLELQRKQGQIQLLPLTHRLNPDSLSSSALESPIKTTKSPHQPSDATLETRSQELLPVQIPPEPPRELMWGRWTTLPLDGDGMTRYYEELGTSKGVTLGTGYAGLYRQDNASFSMPTHLGLVQFNLRDAQAHLYKTNGSIELAQVNSGWLNIHFSTQQFETGLQVSHAELGSVQLTAQGAVNNQGLFAQQKNDIFIGGAVNAKGSEAAYFFQKAVSQGTLNALTYWKR